MDVLPGLALRRGGCVGVGWVEGWFWGSSLGGCHDSGPGPRLLQRKEVREEVWQLKDRAEFSSTLPPAFAAIINHGGP